MQECNVFFIFFLSFFCKRTTLYQQQKLNASTVWFVFADRLVGTLELLPVNTCFLFSDVLYF